MTTDKQQKITTYTALFVLAVIIATVCIIGIYTFGKNDEIIQGQAEISEYRVSSKVPGRILKFNVREGQTVHKGDTLAIIEAPEVNAKMEQAEAVRLAAMAQNKKPKKAQGKNKYKLHTSYGKKQ